MLCSPDEIFLGARVQGSGREAARWQTCLLPVYEGLHKVGEVQSLGKMSCWKMSRFGSWLPPTSSIPFFPLCHAMAIPAGAALTAGLLVPAAGKCPRFAPSVSVSLLPGRCHSYGGSVPYGIARLLRCAAVQLELQPLGCQRVNRCVK